MRKVLSEYWATKKAVWSPTTYATERSRYNTLCGHGFPTASPQALFESLKQQYKRYTVKQFFIRACVLEEAAGMESNYRKWMNSNPEAFRGSYKTKTRCLSKEDIDSLVWTAAQEFPHLSNLLVLMAFGGLRKSEALNAKTEHLDTENEILFVAGGKGARNREIPFPTSSLGSLLSLEEAPYLCTYNGVRIKDPSRSLTKLAKITDINFTPHDLRAYCLTQYSKVLTPFELARFAGHSSIKTTERYIRHNTNQMRERIKEIL